MTTAFLLPLATSTTNPSHPTSPPPVHPIPSSKSPYPTYNRRSILPLLLTPLTILLPAQAADNNISNISLDRLWELVDEDQVERVEFSGNFYQNCQVVLKGKKGVLRVTEDYPVEQSRGPESPLAVVANLRER